jgi:ADP-ribose pyrophosphatase YjhB (NUDIX family)
MINVYVRAFLYKDKNTVLLIRHSTESFGYGLYGMVGGNIQQGETALQAIKRKVFEEVGD